MIAANLGLDNLVVIVDWNGIQGSGTVADVSGNRAVPGNTGAPGLGSAVIDGHHIQLKVQCVGVKMIDVTALADPEKVYKQGSSGASQHLVSSSRQ